MSETPSGARLKKLKLALHLIGAAVTLTIAVVFAIVVYRPLNADEQRFRRLTSSTKEFLGRTDELQRDAEELEDRLVISEQLFEEAITRIPEDAQKTEFLAELSQLASETGMEIRDFRPGDEVDRGTHHELTIHVNGEAGYESLCRFLSGVEKLDRLTQLTSLSVSGTAGTEQYPVNMSVVIFYKPGDETIAEAGESDESAAS